MGGKMKKIISYCLGILVLSYSAFASVVPDQNDGGKISCDKTKPVEKNVYVERTFDGDTVLVRTKSGNLSVRMIGIDTPETHFMGQTQGEWGDIAAARLADHLPPNTKVRLELSPSVCDSYGRLLAHIFVGKRHINQEMAAEGLAVNYCLYPSVDYCEQIGGHTKTAMKQRIGMFSDPTMELPYDFRRRVSGRQSRSFVGNLRTKIVYRPGNQERVPVDERIFFSGEETIPPEYKLAK
jgi:micrococcal nuclease